RGGQDRRYVRDDRRGGAGHDGLHAADVVRDPRLDLPGTGPGEERQRQPLQMPVDGGAQVVHDSLADRVRKEGLRDAERARRDRDRDHAHYEAVSSVVSWLGIASSSTARRRKGETIPSAAENRMRTSTAPSTSR